MADLKECVQELRDFLRRQTWQRYNTGAAGFSMSVQGMVLVRLITETDEKGKEVSSDFIATTDWDSLTEFFSDRGYSFCLAEDGTPVINALKEEVIAS